MPSGSGEKLDAALAAASLATAQALYLFAPLLVSAALGGTVMRRRWLQCLDRPLDHGTTVGDRRWLGDGKRGAGSCSLNTLSFDALSRRLAKKRSG